MLLKPRKSTILITIFLLMSPVLFATVYRVDFYSKDIFRVVMVKGQQQLELLSPSLQITGYLIVDTETDTVILNIEGEKEARVKIKSVESEGEEVHMEFDGGVFILTNITLTIFVYSGEYTVPVYYHTGIKEIKN